MKLLYIAGTLARGGAEQQLLYQLKALRGTNIDPHVVCPRPNGPIGDEIRLLGVALIDSSASSTWGRLWRMLRIARRVSPDLIHSQHFYTNLHAYIMGRLLRVPEIGSIQSDIRRVVQYNRPWSFVSLRAPSWMTVNSKQAMASALEMGRHPECTFLLENTFDFAKFDSFQALSAWPADRVAILTVARLIPAKRVDRFLRTIALVRRKHPEAIGIIAGSGPLRSHLGTLAGELGLMPDGVRFLGERSDVPALMRAADIFALTSDYEGLPNVIQEALAASLPIVSTAVGAVPELITLGETGFVAEPDQLSTFADALCTLIADPERRVAMGKAGRQRALSLFSLDSSRQQLERIYESVLSAR